MVTPVNLVMAKVVPSRFMARRTSLGRSSSGCSWSTWAEVREGGEGGEGGKGLWAVG